jgi:hypothetical protein
LICKVSQEKTSFSLRSAGFSLKVVFFLLPDKILQDFQSTVIKEEWEKRQKYLLAKNNKRRMEDFQFQEALKERMAAVRQQQATVQSQLDEKAESLQAQFADTSVGMKHDADRLAESLSIQPKVWI